MIDDLWFLSAGDATSQVINNLIKDVSKIALIIGAACFIISIVFDWLDNVLKAYESGAEKQPVVNFNRLIKGAIILMLIAIYPLLSHGYIYVVREINKMTKMDIVALKEYNGRLTDLNEKSDIPDLQEYTYKQLCENYEKFIKGKSEDEIKKIEELKASIDCEQLALYKAKGLEKLINMLNPARMQQIIVGGLVKGIIVILRTVIKGVAVYLFQILLIFGSLALAFSLLKTFENTFEIWFKTTLTVGLSITTINILDHVSNGMMSVITNSNINTLDSHSALSIQVILIVCYVSTFWITGKFVAKTDAGGFLTKVVAITTLALKAAASSVTGGKK